MSAAPDGRGTRPGGGTARLEGDKRAPAPGAGGLGMALFLVSLGVLFAGALVAFWVVRLGARGWPPVAAPPLPRSLWLSTALLGAASALIESARRAIRGGDRPALEGRLVAATLLSVAFLGCQVWSWVAFFDRTTFEAHLYGFTFYMLTGLHALHAVGGTVALGAVSWRARRGAYSWAHHPGVRHLAAYWHFLGAAWLALFVSLLLAS